LALSALHPLPTRRSSDLRTWRGSPASVAQDPAFNATCRGRFYKKPPQDGIRPCYSGLQVQGTATSPSSTTNTNAQFSISSFQPKDRKSTRLNSSHVKISY